jgi:hypothetical protein
MLLLPVVITRDSLVLSDLRAPLFFLGIIYQEMLLMIDWVPCFKRPYGWIMALALSFDIQSLLACWGRHIACSGVLLL